MDLKEVMELVKQEAERRGYTIEIVETETEETQRWYRSDGTLAIAATRKKDSDEVPSPPPTNR
jgi:peptide subunit release factor 1 (eRF1)